MFYAGQSSKDYYTAKNGKLLYFFISRKETNIHSIRLMWNSIENLCCWYLHRIIVMYFYSLVHICGKRFERIVLKSRFFKESFIHHQKFKIKLSYCNSRHQETNFEISTGNVPKSHAKYFIHIHSKLTWSRAIFLFLPFGNEFSIKSW